MSEYHNPLRTTHVLAAATLSTLAELATFSGPEGMQGRVESISVLVTTATTADVTIVSIGDGTDVDKYATNTVPIASIDAVANTTVSLTTDDNLIPANALFTIDTDGGCTAGAGNITVVVAWF
jgi:hypothetical protein